MPDLILRNVNITNILIVAFIAVMAAAAILCVIIILRAIKFVPAKRRGKNEIHIDAELTNRAAVSLAEAVRFKTISGQADPTAYRKELLGLAAYLQTRYPKVNKVMQREVIGGYSVIYRWPCKNSSKLPILFCAHMDVVPADGKWEHKPFAGDIFDGYVYGRGTLDCKNVLIGLMEAAESLIEGGFKPDRDIYFAFGHDEEIGGLEGAGAIARHFSINNIRFDMVLDEGGFVSKGYMGVNRPVASVAVTEKGFLNLRLQTKSSGGHSAAPPRHSAIGIISEAVCRIEYKQNKPVLLPVVKEQLKRLAPYMSPSMKIAAANTWILKKKLFKKMSAEPQQNALIRTTTASTMAQAGTASNVLPQSASVILNFRIIHTDSCARVVSFVSELVKNLGAEVEVLREDEPSNISDYNSFAFKSIEKCVKNVFGDIIIIPAVMTGGTDARKYEGLCGNVFRFAPFMLTAADTAAIHASNERIRIDVLGAAVEFYKKLIKDFCGSEETAVSQPPQANKKNREPEKEPLGDGSL